MFLDFCVFITFFVIFAKSEISKNKFAKYKIFKILSSKQRHFLGFLHKDLRYVCLLDLQAVFFFLYCCALVLLAYQNQKGETMKKSKLTASLIASSLTALLATLKVPFCRHYFTKDTSHLLSTLSKVLFITFAFIPNLSTAKISPTQQAQIQQQIKDIQKHFQTKISHLESSLTITIEAERKGKDKTRSLTSSEYEVAYKNYENEKNSAKELEKYYTKNTQEIIQKAKDSASTWGIASEFSEFEASLRQTDSAFLADMREYKKRLEALEKTQKSTHKKSAYKEKMEWLVQEFDNKYEWILFDAYSSFVEKIGEILGK